MPDLDTLRETTWWLFLHEHRAWIGPSITAIAFIESFAIAGVAVPGILLLAVAALAAGGAEVPLWHALGYAFVGAVAGDTTSFAIGRALGPRLQQVGLLARHPQWIESGEAFFQRHGVWSLVLGRFVGPLRPLMPLLAGSLGFAPRRFVLVNLASALAWAPNYILPGYLLGASVALELERPPGLVPGLLVLALWVWLCGRLIARAWRLGAPAGPLRDTAADELGLLQPALPGSSDDTRASLLLALGTAAALLSVTLAVVVLAPWLAPWRDYLLAVAQLTLELL